MKMDQMIEIVSSKLKLIRIEHGYTQDKMASTLGISKKTLLQIEKQRMQANWTTVAAVAAIFRDSEILKTALGGDPVELVEILAHEGIERPKEQTLGGKVWWKDMKCENGFRLQQNLISKHYRILDDDNHRWYSSFDIGEAYERLNELVKS
ncbi:helix-turn-helix transcriptional regulator [Pseudalkalibacillus salsuginis]|uniref:helix-turn-helix transcriptional regulator n=1 Tax=Pseudalkalibacillus salsuginis TaxID=2910972 RepID=UPI001F3463B2|nr:helix-turn-helix domain-containing protein [Pseudalkalibacillus salsuginis]MCF6410383.1 helix-turn-helix domain-containing protein [Pseudalkalibacillus salsuginis]